MCKYIKLRIEIIERERVSRKEGRKGRISRKGGKMKEGRMSRVYVHSEGK